MKQLFTLMALAVFCTAANAQTDTTAVPQDSTREMASVKTDNDTDTIRIGNIIIIKRKGKDGDRSTTRSEVRMGRRNNNGKPSNVSTNWFILDLGFNNYNDQTNYGAPNNYLANRPGAAPLGKGDFALKTNKSINVNIWFFMQRLNLVKHYVNLKYGLGLELNNYRYKSAISYRESNPFDPTATPSPVVFRDSIAFSKNKLAADYLTVPFMLNFTTNPNNPKRGLSLSAGVSAGYLYSQRNKQISSERGKLKNKGDYDLEQFKFSYIAEVGLGPVKLYGTYSPNSMYQRGMDIRPYALGIRLSNW